MKMRSYSLSGSVWDSGQRPLLPHFGDLSPESQQKVVTTSVSGRSVAGYSAGDSAAISHIENRQQNEDAYKNNGTDKQKELRNRDRRRDREAIGRLRLKLNTVIITTPIGRRREMKRQRLETSQRLRRYPEETNDLGGSK